MSTKTTPDVMTWICQCGHEGWTHSTAVKVPHPGAYGMVIDTWPCRVKGCTCKDVHTLLMSELNPKQLREWKKNWT